MRLKQVYTKYALVSEESSSQAPAGIKPCSCVSKKGQPPPQPSPFVQTQVTYGSYQHVPGESLAEVLLRTGKLAETETQGEEVFPTTEGTRLRFGDREVNPNECARKNSATLLSNPDSLTRHRLSFILDIYYLLFFGHLQY